jgi:hypothetical protein
MTAAWKQKKFERLAQKDVVEKLKGELQQLHDRLIEQKESRKYYEERMKIVYQQRDQAMILANRYNLLRTQELMIATPDGFKLVTGEELDIHCGAIQDRESPKVSWPAQHMAYTISPGEALDSWHLTQQSQKFNEAFAQAMLYGTSIVKMVKENGNTRSTSQEEDKKNP